MTVPKLSVKQTINLKIGIMIFMLVIGSFSAQHLWPFIPFDMYCKERAEIKKSFWYKIIDREKSFFVRVEFGIPVPKRFYFKSNLLGLKELKQKNPEKLQLFLNQMFERVSKKRKKTDFKLELYEQTHRYENEKIVEEKMELLGVAG